MVIHAVFLLLHIFRFSLTCCCSNSGINIVTTDMQLWRKTGYISREPLRKHQLITISSKYSRCTWLRHTETWLARIQPPFGTTGVKIFDLNLQIRIPPKYITPTPPTRHRHTKTAKTVASWPATRRKSSPRWRGPHHNSKSTSYTPSQATSLQNT
jgi:hypothetical protein